MHPCVSQHRRPPRRRPLRVILSALAAAAVSAAPCGATAILVETSADNTLYVSAVPVSNGGGSHIFTGRTLEGHARRAVLRFDLTQLPPGTVVTSAQLQMVCVANGETSLGAGAAQHELRLGVVP